MSLETAVVRYGEEKEYTAYASWPKRASLPLPAVMVLQEAWGVDAHIEDVTRRFALAGYVAFAPDLFVEKGERPAPLAKDRVAEAKELFNVLGAAAMDPVAREAELARRP